MISFYAFGVGDRRADCGAVLQQIFAENNAAVSGGDASLVTHSLLLDSYVGLAAGRLISGFPHGAIFGVGAIILSKIAPPGKVTVAVAG